MASGSGRSGPDQMLSIGNLKTLSEVGLVMYRHYGAPDPNLSAFSGALAQSEMMSSLPLAMIKEESRQVHSLLSWVGAGMPAFDLTHGLMAALLLTDPGDVAAELVRLPFSTFIVRLPEGFWELHGLQGAETTATLVIVHSYLAITSKSDDLRAMLSFQILGKVGSTSTWEARLAFPESGSIGDWIAEDVETIGDPSGAVFAPDELDHEHAVAFRRLLVNLCLYVTAHGRGEKQGKRKTEKSSTRPRDRIDPDLWLLGREVKLDPQLVRSAKAWSDSRGKGKSRAAWDLQARFTVRGHWRNQAHGPGRTQHRLRWIAPFWKGEGPSFAHVYKVGPK